MSLWRKYSRLSNASYRSLCTATEVETITEEQKLAAMDDEERLVYNAQKFGADLAFNTKKHGYILSFPWNYDEIIKDFEDDFTPLKSNSFWYTWVKNRELMRSFSELFRVFHQSCAIPEEEGLDRVCEPKFKNYMMKCLQNIHFHGMDVEMVNLRVHQPQIDILNVEIHHGLNLDRTQNKPKSAYRISDSKFLGAPMKVYKDTTEPRSFLENMLNENNKPYLVSITTLIHSPMKMFVYNQNRSKILFGTDDDEIVKNVVKFEVNLKWTEFFKILPVENKPLLSRQMRITDYNNVMNENPYFEE